VKHFGGWAFALLLVLSSFSQAQSLDMCNAVDFSTILMPPITAPDAFVLAMTLSGSYEGPKGWANLSDNFDGEGMSFGLLQQNFGTGSLQPLLIEMRDNYPTQFQEYFSSQDLQNLLGMLAQWEANKSDSQSVKWAVNNLYVGGSFIPRWKEELTNLAQSPEYVSIQAEAGMAIHASALRDVSVIGVDEVRTYLLAFDVEVHGGGFYPEDFRDYATWLKQNQVALTI